ncbi:MAG: hypothetical protein RR135_02435 [Oscillospiraceae bacterium]
MHYPLRVRPGEPDFDGLPVLKLHCDVGVPINERLYAQAQLGLCERCFFVRLWAFETQPLPDSRMTVLLEGPQGQLRLSAQASGTAALLLSGCERNDALTAWSFSGEDLQGEYWGMSLLMDAGLFYQTLGLSACDRSSCIRGNILKEQPSLSALFPVAPGHAADDPACFGQWKLC